MFSFNKEEESKGSPLFAALLGGAALGAVPLTDTLRKKLLVPSLENVRKTILTETMEPETVKELKKRMLDKRLKDLPVIATGKGGSHFQQVSKGYLPDRKEVERLLRSGGVDSADLGRIDPLKVIRDARATGGLIKYTPGGHNPVTIAHELGHATGLNKGEWLRGSKLYAMADDMGRRALKGGPKRAALAALLAGSFSSDDSKKWIIPGALLATQAPLLYEEATASLRGMKALREIAESGAKAPVMGPPKPLVSKEVLKQGPKFLRRALGTYGLGSLGLLAAPLLGIAARSQYDKTIKE